MTSRYRVLYSPQSFSELREIHAYIAQDSPDRAAGMIEAILNAVDLLAQAPHRQLVRPPAQACNTTDSVPPGASVYDLLPRL
jgi:plasmid stabilization system protein ParE